MDNVIKSDPVSPLPGQPAPKEIVFEATDVKLAALYSIYILYKANMLNRNNVREIIEILNASAPKEGIAKYLVNEAAKAT